MSPKIIIVAVVTVVAMGSSFYGGMVYGKGNQSNGRGTFQGQFQGRGAGAVGGMRGPNGMGGGFTVGEIILKDDTSITLKMQDGGTRIVLVGSSTQVMKSTPGTVEDLAIGSEVTVAGSGNTDGSITAQSVQIRPDTVPMRQGSRGQDN